LAIAVKTIDDDDDDGEMSISSFKSRRRILIFPMFLGVVILVGTILGILLPGNNQERKSSSNSTSIEVTNLVDR